MTETSGNELKVQGKHAVSTSAEQTRPGVAFSPKVDIYETAQQIMLLADLPGVKPDDLKVDLRDNILTISGDVDKSGNGNGSERDLLIEYEVGRYFRQFSLSEVIDQGRIDAQLKDGVLHLTLPKVAKASPRTIKVTAE
jgi:HSP20 family molecular chaperone IbpA